MNTYNLAVVGATGNIGRLILEILAERNFPIANIYALSSSASIGQEVSFGDERILKAESLEGFDFSKVDIAFFAVNNEITKKYAKLAAKHCLVIDNSSVYRMDKDVPLIVPEVNPESIKDHKNIIANPNCAALQLVVALKPLNDICPIKRIVVSTYQSVSGAGKGAMDELYNHTKGKYTFQDHAPEHLPQPIAFNLFPHIDHFDEDGSTKEENKFICEIKKILDPEIQVAVTCVRVPVFVGHSEAVNIEFEDPITVEEVLKSLSHAPGIVISDIASKYHTPIDVVNEDAVFVSRIRKDNSVQNGINMWVVSDNLRKGGALNAVQIAELYIEQHSK